MPGNPSDIPVPAVPDAAPRPVIGVRGYLGQGNMGDNLLLATLQATWARVNPTMPVTWAVCGDCPVELQRRLRVMPVRDMAEVEGLVMLGGMLATRGGNSLRSILDPVFLAHEAHQPVLWWGVGVNPLLSVRDRHLVGDALRHSRAVVVRDTESRQWVETCQARATVATDVAWLAAPALVPPRPFPRQGTIIVPTAYAAIPWEELVVGWQVAIELAPPPCTVLLWDDRADGKLFNALYETVVSSAQCRWRAPGQYHWGAVRHDLWTAQGLVAGRLHSALLAGMAGVPHLWPVCYNRKVWAAAEALDIVPNLIPWGNGITAPLTTPTAEDWVLLYQSPVPTAVQIPSMTVLEEALVDFAGAVIYG